MNRLNSRFPKQGPAFSNFFFSVVDQGVSSASNLLLAVAVARTAAVAEFGAFTLMFGGYILLRAIVRALVGVPLTISQMHPGRGERNPEFGAASISSLAIGLVGSLVFVGVVVTAHGDVRMMAAVLALSMPPLMLQDTIRYMAISQRRAGLAAGSDAIWLAVQVAGFVAYRDACPTVPVAAWGLGGIAGCLMLRGTSGKHPFRDGASAGQWLRGDLDRRRFYVAEALSNMGLAQASFFLLAALAGLSVVAGVRAGFAVLGLASAVLAGLSPAITTEVSRAKEDHLRQRWILTLFVAVGAVSSAAVAAGALLLSESAGHALLGATWASAKPTLVPLAVALSLFTPVSAMVILLNVRGQAGMAFRTRLIGTLPVPLALLLPAAHASSWAAAVAWAVGSGLGMIAASVACKSYLSEPASTWNGGGEET